MSQIDTPRPVAGSRPMTLSEFRAEVERELQSFTGGWAALQSREPDAFPPALPFEEWWCDFTEAVDCDAITGAPAGTDTK